MKQSYLAQKLRISEVYLRKMFNSLFNESTVKCINHRKIYRACKLLLESDLPAKARRDNPASGICSSSTGCLSGQPAPLPASEICLIFKTIYLRTSALSPNRRDTAWVSFLYWDCQESGRIRLESFRKLS